VSWVEAEYICDIVVAPGPSVRVSGGYATFLFRLTGNGFEHQQQRGHLWRVDVRANYTADILYQRFTNSPPAGYLVSVPMLITFSEGTPIAAKLTSFVEIKTNLTDANGIADFSHTFTLRAMDPDETNGHADHRLHLHQSLPTPLLTYRGSDKGKLLLNLLAPALHAPDPAMGHRVLPAAGWNIYQTYDISLSDSLDLEIDPDQIAQARCSFRTIQDRIGLPFILSCRRPLLPASCMPRCCLRNPSWKRDCRTKCISARHWSSFVFHETV